MGGRMATRRVSIAGHNLSFDHGAQYFTSRNPAFAAQIAAAGDSVARWDDGAGETRLVGCPGMASLPLPQLVREGTEQLLRLSQLEGQLLEQLFGAAAAARPAAAAPGTSGNTGAD